MQFTDQKWISKYVYIWLYYFPHFYHHYYHHYSTFINPQLHSNVFIKYYYCLNKIVQVPFTSKYNLKSSMNSKWFISPVWNSYPGLAVPGMCVGGMKAITNSNSDSTSPWKISFSIGTSLSDSVRQVSSTLQDVFIFPKNCNIFLLCPSYFTQEQSTLS